MLLICIYTLLLWFGVVISQPITGDLSQTELDSLLQDYAFRAFVRPRTGIIYNGKVPPNLIGIQVAAVRLRSGSLRRRGVQFKEFNITVGVVEQPYVTRLVLVYQNLGNFSTLYYNLSGYRYLTPVLGLLAYNASNLSATNLPVLNLQLYGDPIRATFPAVRSRVYGNRSKCVSFGLDGSPEFDNVVEDNTCLITKQGHFSIAVKEEPVAPAPVPVTAPYPRGGGGKGGASRKVGVIVGSVVGGVVFLVFLSVLFVYLRKCSHRKKIRRMETASEVGVTLPMTTVGSTKAPVASETRTRPSLETEFVP